MDSVFEALSSTFPFNQLTLSSPVTTSNKQHFCKALVNKKPIFVQSPKCKTKQGIIKSGKKQYTDLVFTNFDEDLIEWIETLETKLRNILFANRDKWFDMDLTEDDIESYFNPTIKLFKSGKLYLLRALLNQNVRIYDENENAVDISEITDTTELITILEFTGILCSYKSFQLAVEVKQVMITKPVAEVFNKCIIKTSSNKDLGKIPNESEPNVVLPEPENNPDDKPVSQPVAEPSDNIVITPDESADLSASNKDVLQEFTFEDDCLANAATIQLKEKTEVYYELYREARRKAKLAKSLALSSFLEAKRIKNLYMLDDIDSDESDVEELDDLDDYETLM